MKAPMLQCVEIPVQIARNVFGEAWWNDHEDIRCAPVDCISSTERREINNALNQQIDWGTIRYVIARG